LHKAGIENAIIEKRERGGGAGDGRNGAAQVLGVLLTAGKIFLGYHMSLRDELGG